jgi:hypothetical protein
LRGDKTSLLQPDDRVVYGDMGDSQPLGKVHDARFARFCNQIGDGLHVVFRDLIRVFAAGLGQVFRLAFGAAASTRSVGQFFFCRCHLLSCASKSEAGLTVQQIIVAFTTFWNMSNILEVMLHQVLWPITAWAGPQ